MIWIIRIVGCRLRVREGMGSWVGGFKGKV